MAAPATLNRNRNHFAGMLPNQDIVYEILDHVGSRTDKFALARTCWAMFHAVLPDLLQEITLTHDNIRQYLEFASRFPDVPRYLRILNIDIWSFPSQPLRKLARVIRRAHRLSSLYITSLQLLFYPRIAHAIRTLQQLRELAVEQPTPSWLYDISTPARGKSAVKRLKPVVQSLHLAYLRLDARLSVLATFPRAPFVYIYECDGFDASALPIAFPGAHTLVIDGTSGSYTKEDLDHIRHRNVETLAPQVHAPYAIDSLRCSVAIAYALAVGLAFDVRHLSLGGCCPHAPDSDRAMDHPENQDFLQALKGVLSSIRPRELELGCWGFVRNVNHLADALLPHSQTLQTLRIHLRVEDGASDRCAIYALLPLCQKISALRNLHISVLTDSWTSTIPLEEQSETHPSPGHFAQMSFGTMNLQTLAMEFFHAAPRLNTFSAKVFDKDTVIFGRPAR